MKETVCVDLKPVLSILQEDSRKQIVYMVDSFSSFTAVCISDSKEANKVVDVSGVFLVLVTQEKVGSLTMEQNSRKNSLKTFIGNLEGKLN